MLIEEKALSHWMNCFYGYGSWQSRFWFVAHEDGGGDLPEEVAEKLNYFYSIHEQTKQPTLCNIRDMYRHFSIQWEGPKAGAFANLYDLRFGDHAQLSNVWKNLISFIHGYLDEVLPDFLEYQKNNFVQSQAENEALIKLYPLPSPHNHAWYYSWLDQPRFPFLKSRALYQEHLFTSRMKNILENMKLHQPEVVLMYGMENINMLKKSIQEVFPDAKFKAIKAISRLIPQHHRADINKTILLVTTQIPTLRHNRIETGFDWEEFGKRIRSQSR